MESIYRVLLIQPNLFLPSPQYNQKFLLKYFTFLPFFYCSIAFPLVCCFYVTSKPTELLACLRTNAGSSTLTRSQAEFSISTKPAEEHSAGMSERWQREEKDHALAKNHTSFNVLKLPEGCLLYNKEANIAPRDRLCKLCDYDICTASFTSC